MRIARRIWLLAAWGAVALAGCDLGAGASSARAVDGAAADEDAADGSGGADASCGAGACDEPGDGGDGDAAQDDPFVVWMDPAGDDALGGLNEARAVATLGRVQEILEEHAPQRAVEVRIGEGRYRGQKVRWTFSVAGEPVRLTRESPEADRPIFDGCVAEGECPGGTWFRLQRSDGADTRIEFNYLQIENYQTAISLDGNRNDPAASNGTNAIYGCVFRRIGNVFNGSLDPSTAAVRLVNSDDNEIANSHFVDIINTTSENRLHAIYIAHLSERNRVLRNRFVNNSGDPVRVRDGSNENGIHDNRFIKTGQFAGYTEWYCDHEVRDDCTKSSPECPSWGNEFRRNELDGTYQCDALATFEFFQDDTTDGCAPPSTDVRRLRTSDNTQSPEPCEGY